MTEQEVQDHMTEILMMMMKLMKKMMMGMFLSPQGFLYELDKVSK